MVVEQFFLLSLKSYGNDNLQQDIELLKLWVERSALYSYN